jgi:hypothetical protein
MPLGRARNRGLHGGVLLLALALVLGALPAMASSGGTTLDVAVEATGSGRSNTPGRACADGGDGAYWHYDYRGPVPHGTLNTNPAELRVHLDVHSDVVRFPHVDPEALGDQPGTGAANGPAAFLAGTTSRATFVDARGTLETTLASGACGEETLAFDGTTATGDGTWTVRRGTGGYEGATGGGTFAMTAEVFPGAANDLQLAISGPITVLRPNLEVDVVRVYWGGLGADYLTRRW